MEIFIVLFGLIIGSFLNVVIYRLPRGESLVHPSSHCPQCNHCLSWLDLFPIFSWLCLKGSCRYCHTRVSWRYPVVELLTGVLTLLTWYRFSWSVELIVFLFLTYILIAIAFIDFDLKIIPNVLTIPTLVFGIVFQLWQGHFGDALIGGLVGGGILLLVVLLYPKGMGMGDVKYLAMTGVFLGWAKVSYSLFLGCLIGMIVMVPLLLLKKMDRKKPFAFGPFLVIATLIMIYYGDWIMWFHFGVR